MKRILLLLALLCSSAIADTTSTPLPTAGSWTLVRGNTGAVGWNFGSAASCYAAAPSNAEALRSSSTYVCRQDLKFTVTYTKPVNPFPGGETQVVQCVAPDSGSWTQTRTYALVGGKWVAGAWTPAAAPAGACTPPVASTVTNWVTVATERNQAFTYIGPVRYGWGTGWLTKTFSGPGSCNSGTFGGDPAPGISKWCQVQLSAPNVVQTGGMPVINVPLMQPPLAASSTADVITGGSFLTNSDIGAFRTTCGVSHLSFDDPIVFPGQPGKSHLHLFFGNASASAATTIDNILTTGDSTCAGGIVNRTGYWIPALVNLATGAPVIPSTSIWYYKAGYLGVDSAAVQPFPQGLRMIAGSSVNKTPIQGGWPVRIICQAANDGVIRGYIPDCAVGETIEFIVIFPQCWDGVNLDSADHKSHMAYGTGTGCPADHPVPLPEVSLNVSYLVTEARPDLNWKLSSDNYPGQPGGYSMHADWFGGWRDDIMRTFVTQCINKKNSSGNALCDGRYLN